MLETMKARGLAALWPALIGMLLGMGIMLPVLGALEVGGAGLAVVACVLTAVSCVAVGFGGKHRLISIGVGAGILFLFLLMTGVIGSIFDMFGAAVQLIRGNSAPIRAFGPQAAALFGCVLTLGGWAMARQGAGFFPALSLTMIALLGIWFSSSRDAVTLFAPALVALCAMFARSVSEETSYPRALIAGALVVGIGLAVTPLFQFRSPRMEKFADDLRTFITDTLFFTEARNVYSLHADGYKPLETRLGGPVDIEERPVMTVKTHRSILLRGVIYNHYTGLNWMDRLSTRRYLYADPRNRALRVDMLDEERPSAQARSGDLFKAYDIKVTMQSDSASTLFLPLRATEIVTPMSLVPYFNSASEIFITRNLEAGDTYSMSAPVINSSDPRLAEALMQAMPPGGDGRDMSDYLQLPSAIASELYELTRSITNSVASPLDTALAIQNFLRITFPYTLKPDVPPGDQDFVSYFVLRGKEGYCTYFASAMAVMGRIAGLPTRYVEGYIVDPSGGTALVTSKHAHAWAEVYFEGFGWVAFDATPTESRGGPRRDENPNEQEEAERAIEEGGEDEDSAEPEPTPTPEPPESESPDTQPEPEQQPEQEPSPEPEESPEDTPEESPEDDPQPDDWRKKNSSWWIWLLVLALIGAGTGRALWTRPDAIVGRQGSLQAKLMVWYRALLGLLAASGMPARPYESPLAYAARVEETVPEEAGFVAVAVSVGRVGYAHEKVRAQEVEAAARCYRAVYKTVPLRGKVKWLVRRMTRGIGDIRQVP